MDRSRSKLDIFGIMQRQIDDVCSQLGTLRNQNLALPDWVNAPTLQGAWVNFGGAEDNAAFWRDSSGNAQLRGVIMSGAIPSLAFTLPVGFRPGGTRRFPLVSNGAFGYITVAANGQVTVSAGNNTYVDLAAVQFRAEK